ncbi:MAG TPA: endonuclease/exonuclease/phosphatase family protein [Solirubrobacterales bacterium]|nr:endonuclease/exonuclease/phosphatase family protein [Solirubrobacterales bacterium]
MAGLRPHSRTPLTVAILAVLALAGMLAAPVAADAAKKRAGKGTKVKVMTRNLFLGADLGPAISAPNTAAFAAANGGILRDVDETDFPRRARLLANEIRNKKPDLVGLQEVALWRTAEPSAVPVLTGVPTATDVKYDFLALLLAEINRDQGKKAIRYRPVVAQPEFDFEAPADYNEEVDDGIEFPGFEDAEINGRLTMRDVILRRMKAGVKVRNPRGGNFQNPLELTVSGLPVTVTRGWTSTVARVRGSKRFKFVNTHLEAFDDESVQPSIRRLQALEVVNGPAKAKMPVVLLGDFNSDTVTEVQEGDAQAFRAILNAGFKHRATRNPRSCCVNDLFSAPPTQFDHVVDHVVAKPGKRVKRLASSVVGLSQIGGIYPSDHAGVFSRLRIR